MYILVNQLSCLAKWFDISIKEAEIVLRLKEEFADAAVGKELFNMYRTWAEMYASVSCSSVNKKITFRFTPENRFNNAAEFAPECEFPNLSRISDIIYPLQSAQQKCKEGDVYVLTFVKKSLFHKVVEFKDDDGNLLHFTYSDLYLRQWRDGCAYEIKCLGMQTKTKRNPYPKMEFSVTQISN